MKGSGTLLYSWAIAMFAHRPVLGVDADDEGMIRVLA
jgi:hypothetical protein